MKKLAAVIFILLLGGALAGCCTRHEWENADCEHPATCVKCGRTNGDALRHIWKAATCAAPRTCVICGATEGEAAKHRYGEANYQRPATCSICGATYGEPLLGDFERYGLTCEAKQDIMYPYTTLAERAAGYVTSGKVKFTDYRILSSDSAHEALDGYEWRSVELCFYYNDKTARNYGAASSLFATDYYVCGMKEGDGRIKDEEKRHAVNYNGTDYTKCITREQALETGWNDGVYTCRVRYSFRVPSGYDGIVVGVICDGKYNEGEYLYDTMGDNDGLLMFRLD